MKEQYIKPVLKMEMFTLTQTIAQTCGTFGDSTLGKPNHSSSASCGWDMGNVVVWANADVCTLQWPENGDFEGVCLHNPNGGVTIFGS